MTETSRPVIEALFRYPVKSMQGEQMSAAQFENGHVAGDRQWAVIDVESGFTLSAKRHGALLEARALTEEDGAVVITIPGAGNHAAGDPGTDAALSAWLGRRVTLRCRQADALSIELLVDALDDASEIIAFPVPEGHFADMADAHIITTSSLRAASALHPTGDWDIRRFRPTAVVKVEEEGFVEDAWVGSTVSAGEVRLEVFMPTIRCSLPPRSQPGLVRDTAVARVLTDHHNFCFGVYAACRHDGWMRVGDQVDITPA